MHKTIYIEKDEEITSIVSKIKNEKEGDIFLVIPKGALLSQGMINLKLLKKEADRLEKELFIITGDEQTKKVIAKVGLKIGEINKLDEEKKESAIDLFAEKAEKETLESLKIPEKNTREIGSASFFENKVLDNSVNSLMANSSISEKPLNFVKEFRSSDLRKDLYSRKVKKDNLQENTFENFQKDKNQKEIIFNQKPQEFFQNGFSKEFHLPVHREIENKDERSMIFSGSKSFQKNNFRQAEVFFSEKNEPTLSGKNFIPKKKVLFEKEGNSMAKWILVFVGMVFLFSLGSWFYWNWPKVQLKVYPREKIINGSLDVKILSQKDYILGNNEIKGKYHEVEVEQTVTMDSSGTGDSVSVEGKATGKVIILNKYSSASQNLVAKTRLLSKEGKLFRLTKDILVPGMEGETPGKIEATVIADKVGEDFNIGPSQFTIEGFKGSPKYEKFEVTSFDSMKGGGTGNNGKETKIVSQKDIDSARIKAMDELGKNLSSLVAKDIGENRKYFIDSAGKEILEAFSDFRIGEATDKFNYTVKEKIKLISFNEDELKNLIYENIKQEIGEGFILNQEKIIFSYDKPVVDWEKKQMEIAVSYEGLVFSNVKLEEMKRELLGKNESALKEALIKYNQIEKAELEYYPAWSGRWPALERNFKIDKAEKK